MVLQYFYSSEYSLMLFGETWKCKVWIHSSGKFANSSEFNVTSTDGMIRLRFKLMSFKIDGIIFFKKFSKLSRISLRVFSAHPIYLGGNFLILQKIYTFVP